MPCYTSNELESISSADESAILGMEPARFASRPLQWKNDRLKPMVNVDTFIGLELSLVAEVERVFVDQKGPREYHALSVINERDPEIRKRIYRREQAIIDAHPNLTFDFDIVCRLDRALEDITGDCGKLAFKRF